ncbi:hypothetical protein SAMN05428942_7298 [Streptomyces sp. 2112.2]|nr:hypothetical protein SAMN05428942_7298 [Streptomyces sp. 2112.2]
MSGEEHDTSQRAELYGPEGDGLYTSQLHDWIPLCPQLRDSAVRFYWTLRALVIEKRGPVRKLTLREMCYLLPAKPVPAGEDVKPSSLARIRSLLTELSDVGLLSTPEGDPIRTSSRASASAAPLRIRIHDRPRRGYAGPPNAFALLDAVRKPAAEAAEQAIRTERARAERRRAEGTGEAGQISSPAPAGQKSSPRGQKSSPRGQKSSPYSAADLHDHEPPFSPPAHTLRSDSAASVRPSVQVGEAPTSETDGRTDGGSGIEGQQGTEPGAGKGLPADHTLERTPGVEVLAAIGAEAPEWRIIGPSLRDQGRTATLLLERGFTPQEIRHVLLSRPLPQPLTHTVAAVIGGRLRELAMSVPAFGIRPIPEQRPVLRERCTTLAAERTKDEALERRVMRECATCQAPIGGDADLCAECSGRPKPLCDAGCGRAVLADGLVCLSCDVPPDDIGVCPGHDAACGRPVVSQGLCRHCLISAEQQRAAREREYEGQVAAAVAAVAAADGQQGA